MLLLLFLPPHVAFLIPLAFEPIDVFFINCKGFKQIHKHVTTEYLLT